jgi:hypothetical protein
LHFSFKNKRASAVKYNFLKVAVMSSSDSPFFADEDPFGFEDDIELEDEQLSPPQLIPTAPSPRQIWTPSHQSSSVIKKRSPDRPLSNAMQYRERDLWERKQKRLFDSQNEYRWRLQQSHSPYRYELGRHREAVQQTFWRDLTRQERKSMCDRSRLNRQYQEAVKESFDHDRRLVKKDYIVPAVHALRILAV